MEAAPTPVRSASDQTRPPGVGFDAAATRQGMIAVVDGEALEAALVEIAAAGGLVMRGMPWDMRDAEPLHHGRQCFGLPRP